MILYRTDKSIKLEFWKVLKPDLICGFWCLFGNLVPKKWYALLKLKMRQYKMFYIDIPAETDTPAIQQIKQEA